MRLKWLSCLLVIMLVLSACGATGTGDGSNHQAESGSVDDASASDAKESHDAEGDSDQAETEYPLTVTDDSGTEVTLEQEPQKIISVLPSTTEIAFALGLDEHIIAVTENDDYPEQVKDKDKVGDMELNMEKIVSLEPDLVLAGLLNGESVQKMRDLGLTVVVSEGEGLDATYDSIRMIGQVTNRAAEAEKIINGMQEDVREVEELTAAIPQDERLNVWLEVDPELFTAGSGTAMDELITLAGGHNVAAEELEGWGQLSAEKVVALDPDVIVGTYGNDQVQQTVADRKAWSELSAVKNDRVIAIDGDILSRPGPRLTEGLKQLAAAFYPEIFEEAS